MHSPLPTWHSDIEAVHGAVPFPRERALDLHVLIDREPTTQLGASFGDTVRSTSADPCREGALTEHHVVRQDLRHVPDQPDVLLSPRAVNGFLKNELRTPELHALQPYLWLASKRDSQNVDALHRHIIKQRGIIVTEEPRLHLIWTVERVFIKPIPNCLLNYDFWDGFLPQRSGPAKSQTICDDSPSGDRRAAVGFLRSYALLIQHRSDLRIAKEHGLVPDDITWDAWTRFIQHFRHLPDEDVAERYHYGQMRLSRLNFATRVQGLLTLSPRWCYELSYWSTLPYMIDAAAPLIFLFAGLSLVMSAMQVMLAANVASQSAVKIYERVFWGFSIAVITISLAAMGLLVILPGLYILKQHIWGFQHRYGRAANLHGKDQA